MVEYKQALKYLDSFVDYEKIIDYPYNASLNLQRMEKLCRFFDNPHQRFRSVHIAGTKGKGSVAAILASILKEAGLKVGLYTSPHLISPRERIRVMDNRLQAVPRLRFPRCASLASLGTPRDFAGQAGCKLQADLLNLEGMISEEEIILLIKKIKPAVERIREDKRLGEVSFFEIYTTLAFLYFSQENVDIAILETGMGGRLDATNVVSPLAVVFTSISLDHTDKLGPGLSEIAGEKAGIIKPGCLAISLVQQEEVAGLIRNVCNEKQVPLYQVNGRTYREYSDLFSLNGRYQRQNLALALETIETLKQRNIKVSPDAIKRGLGKVVWPGRLQVIEESPLLVVDGAQNRASAKALKESIDDFSFNNLILVLGVSANKDIKGMVEELCPGAGQVILTKADNPRAAEPEVLELEVKKYCQSTVLTRSVKKALVEAGQAASKDDLILVTGSLYLVGEVLKNYQLINQPYQ